MSTGQARQRTSGQVTVVKLAAACVLFGTLIPATVLGQSRSIASSRLTWPTAGDVWRVLLLQDYNTRVILLGTMLLGVASGIVGAFMLLRKRALVGDVASHASLPGVATAFLVMEAASPGSGKSLPGLMTGAALAGLLGILTALAIRRSSRIKDDAALAIVLSLFFGLGVSLLRVIQQIPSGNAAGLSQFIYGKASSMLAADVQVIAVCAGVALVVCLGFAKELTVLCFDEDYASAQGWPVTGLDVLLTVLVVGVTVVGMQSVGLMLVVALLIIPGSSARFWSNRLGWILWLSAALGAGSAALGVLVSALFPRLAAGAVIVLAGGFCFLFSLLFGARNGLVHRGLQQRALARRVGRLDLMRALYESVSPADTGPNLVEQQIPLERVVAQRTWTEAKVRSLLRSAAQDHFVQILPSGTHIQLTSTGASEARRVVRNHRLWELFLMTYADIAPSHVDRDADQIEHVLDRETVIELERLLAGQLVSPVPPSPHALIPEGPADVGEAT